MQLEGHVSGGVVILDDATVLAEGTRVRIEPIDVSAPATIAARFQNVIGQATGLPADLAAQHDHYLHGSPKR